MWLYLLWNRGNSRGNCKRRKWKWKWKWKRKWKRVIKITSYYSSTIENGGNLWLVWAIGHNVKNQDLFPSLGWVPSPREVMLHLCCSRSPSSLILQLNTGPNSSNNHSSFQVAVRDDYTKRNFTPTYFVE